jgi:hypothetical protein
LSVDDRVARIEKVRDGDLGGEFPFSLEVINMGTDVDGESVVTCVVGSGDGQTHQKRVKLTQSEQIGLEALREAIAGKGAYLPGTSAIPSGVKAVRIDDWRETFYRRTGEEVDRQHGKEARAFQRARQGLLGKKVVVISMPFVWANDNNVKP